MIGQHTNKGFTLLELLVTLAIAGILASIAVPSMNEFLRERRVSSAAQELTSLFNYARTEAIALNQTITLTTAAGGLDWSGDVAVTDTSATVLRAMTATEHGLSITATADANTTFNFDSSGRLVSNNPIDFTVCSDTPNSNGRNININRVGRTTVTTIECNE